MRTRNTKFNRTTRAVILLVIWLAFSTWIFFCHPEFFSTGFDFTPQNLFAQ